MTYDFFSQVHDRRDEEFIFRLPWDKFPGEGQAVLGDKDESSNVVSSESTGLYYQHHTSITLILDPLFFIAAPHPASHPTVL